MTVKKTPAKVPVKKVVEAAEKPSVNPLVEMLNKSLKAKIATSGLSYSTYNKIPFSSPSMNYLTRGGLPLGKLIEFHGQEASGKTTLSFDVIANAQKIFKQEVKKTGLPAKQVLYLDSEHGLDGDWARLQGVDVEALVLIQPEDQCAEELFQAILDAIPSGLIGMVVIDSIPMLISKAAFGKDMDEPTRGGISAPLSLFSRKATALCSKHNVLLIGINQLRDNMNSKHGGTTVPGGRQWKHQCSMRFKISKGELIDSNGKELTQSSELADGNIIEVAVVKNKITKPDRRLCKVPLSYENGIDKVMDLCFLAKVADILQQSGAWYKLVDIETGEILAEKLQGLASVHAYLRQNEDVYNTIYKILDKKFELS